MWVIGRLFHKGRDTELEFYVTKLFSCTTLILEVKVVLTSV